jgi:hypothetical protein
LHQPQAVAFVAVLVGLLPDAIELVEQIVDARAI